MNLMLKFGEKNSQNPYGKIVSTDQAEVEFHVLDEDVRIFDGKGVGCFMIRKYYIYVILPVIAIILDHY